MRMLIAKGAVALFLALATTTTTGCARTEPLTEHAAVQFAVASSPTPAARVGELRVLARRLNLRQPFFVGIDEGLVTVTFAERQRSGVVLALDPSSLATVSSRPFVYASPPMTTPLAEAEASSSVLLADRRRLVCALNDGRVLLRIDGEAQLLPEMGVLGAPQVVSVDGKRVVVVFVVTGETGFELVALALDT
jgi:hypothetical protein